MKYIIDTCALINLRNAEMLLPTCGLKRCTLSVGQLVLAEAGEELKLEIQSQPLNIATLSDADLPAEDYLAALAEFGLGEGETECIVLAKAKGIGICSDDNRARKAAIKILGTDNVIGSLRLLRWCVEENLAVCSDAFAAFLKMQESGGFLPDLERDFFCAGVEGC